MPCCCPTLLTACVLCVQSDEDNIVEGLRSGSNDFVRKPYQREELLARIETQLRLKTDAWWLAELVNNKVGVGSTARGGWGGGSTTGGGWGFNDGGGRGGPGGGGTTQGRCGDGA